MKKMLLGLNAKGLVAVTGTNAGEFAPCDSPLTVINSDDPRDASRIINFQILFADTTSKYGVVINKNDVLLDNGNIANLKQLFNKYKEDKRVKLPSVNDFIDIQKCFNGEAVISIGSAIERASLKTTRGIVKEIKDGIYTVVVSGVNMKLPSVCVKKVPNNIMSGRMKDIFEFMMNKSKKPVILPEYNFMDVSECGKFITYIAEDRLSRFDGKVWDKDLRAKFATQKKIRGVLSALFNCSDEEMNTVIALYGNTDINVEIVEGKDVYDIFTKSHNSTGGTLGQSCMLGKPKKYFKIYEDNAKVAVIRNEDGTIIVRAVVWNLYSKSTRKRITFLDRIYASDDSMVPLMINWAMKQGWYTLRAQTHSQSSMISPKGAEVKFGDFHVKLKEKSYENYPYIDTMYVIVGEEAYASGYVLSAHSTSGTTGRV